MFQEEIEKLRMTLAEAQEQNSRAEREHKRLSERFSQEQTRANELESERGPLIQENQRLSSELAEAKKRTGDIPRLEAELNIERDKAKDAIAALGSSATQVTTLRTHLSETKNLLSEREQEIVRLNEVLQPMQTLTHLVIEWCSTMDAIRVEQKKLRGKVDSPE